MTFAKPEMLWMLAAAAPLLTWFLVAAWRKRQQAIAQFVQSRLLAQLTVGVSKARQKARLVLLGVAAALILFALARPRVGYAWEEVSQRGLDIVVAIDTSRSMLAADVSPNRLARVKLAALDLMKQARSDRLALVAFAGNAFLQCPLTLDDSAFQQGLNLVEVGLLPQGGTDLSRAIEVSLDALKDSGDNHKAIVLFTDGEDQEGDAVAAAKKAAAQGVKIYTIGVGTATGDRLAITDDKGRTSYVMDENGKPVISKLNLPLLREIAEKTGGDFMALMGADPMQTFYQARLGRLPKGDVSSRFLRQYYERFQWPLGLAIGLLVLEMFLPDRKRVWRRSAALGAGNPELSRVLGCLAALLAVAPALASSSSALKAYEQHDFKESQREYDRLAKKHPDDPRLRFNAGTAAYQSGDLQTATNRLQSATLAHDPQLLQGVYYNLGNALFRIGEHAANPNDIITNWEQALQHYDSALQLDPKDPEAKFNRAVVRTKLEELKRMLQQQQQQQSNRQDQKQPKDRKNQQDQKNQQSQNQQENQKSGDQKQQQQQSGQDQQQKQQAGQESQSQGGKEGQEPKPSEQNASQPQPSPKEPPPSGQKQSDQKPDSQKAQAEEKREDKANAAKASAQPGQADHRDRTNAATATSAQTYTGEMSPQQARQILEAARMDERPWQPLPPRDTQSLTRHIRDW